MAKFAMLFTVAAAQDMSWDDFKNQFGKQYNGGEEDEQRKQVFESNKQQWGQHESGAVLGPTVFYDITIEELHQLNIRGHKSGAA
jgi:hypothetical protein